MNMEISFPGGSRVDASFGPHEIQTDQPDSDGTATAPTPFATFLASIGTCAGIYVLGFLRQRGLSSEGVKLIQSVQKNPLTGMIDRIELDVLLPPEIPERYHTAIVRAAQLCAVKKHLQSPPVIAVGARTAAAV